MRRMTRCLKSVVPMLVIALSACGPADDPDTVLITGSDTMLHLTNAWAEAFMLEHPGIAVNVSGGGSGVGVAALINGNTNICMSSRDMSAEEWELAERRQAAIREYDVALDGLAIVVNAANPVAELTMEQLKRIYTGAYTTWNEVGGPEEPIFVLSRESSSGTYAFFLSHVLDNEDYAARTRYMPSTSAMVQSLSQDQWSIGYVGLAYAEGGGDRIKMLPIKADAASPAILPSPESVLSGAYSIARPLHFYAPEDASPTARQFIEFCLSDRGQQIVADIEYVPVRRIGSGVE